MTAAEAATKKAELFGDAGWVERYLEGGQAERRQMEEITTALASQPQSADQSRREIEATLLRSSADVHPDVVQQYAAGKPMKSWERQATFDLKARLMADPTWTTKYLAGDRECRRQMASIGVNLSLPVED